jgi:hypothetical protein
MADFSVLRHLPQRIPTSMRVADRPPHTSPSLTKEEADE